MTPIKTPKRFNYIGAFLTFRCTYKCPYCINKYGDLKKRKEMSSEEWIRGLSRIQTRDDLPITLSGGEPTCHKGFYEIVEGLRKQKLDILTNLHFDPKDFTRRVGPSVFDRTAKYASIRVSYHPQQQNALDLVSKVLRMQRAGYDIGVWGISYPDEELHNKVLQTQALARNLGIDFRIKEFLGCWKGEMYGTFKYDYAVGAKHTRSCLCRGSELLLGPSGYIYRCHSDLYAMRNPIGHVLDEKLPKLGSWLPCENYGHCNPCDLKVKYNRFQEQGHCSVEIKNVKWTKETTHEKEG